MKRAGQFLHAQGVDNAFRRSQDSYWDIDYCPLCGWWECFLYVTEEEGNIGVNSWESYDCGILKTFSAPESTSPIEVLQTHLLTHYSERFTVNPKEMEDVVGRVFSDFGYSTIVTSYGNDNGVDVYCVPLHKADDIVAVQVKRYKNKIQAYAIREFLGAMVINGATRGVHVTTSDYTRGARRTAEEASRKGFPITLMNADDLLHALGISKGQRFFRVDDPNAPFADIVRGKRAPTYHTHDFMQYE